MHTIVPHAGADDPIRRLAQVRDQLSRVIRLHPPIPELMVMERYAKAKVMGMDGMFTLAECGGAAKLACFDLGIPVVLVRPASVKFFATGKGNADKTLMVHSANALILAGDPLGWVPRNDDEADAWWCRRMGLVAHEVLPVRCGWESEAIEKSGVTSWFGS